MQISYQSNGSTSCSDHSLDDGVDKLLSVSESTKSLSETVSLDFPSSSWSTELEWPQEVVNLSEVWSTGGDLVNDIFHACDTEGTEVLSNDAVVGEWDSSSLNLTVSSGIDDVVDGLS